MGTNYNPQIVTSGLGLVLDAQNPKSYSYSENLVNNSSTVIGSPLASSNMTTVANAVRAPDGTLTGLQLIENTATNVYHEVSGLVIVTANSMYQAYTSSIYVKSNTRTCYGLALKEYNTYFNQAYAHFDVANNVILLTYASNGAVINNTSITPVGNGWSRCTLTTTLNSNVTSLGMETFLIANTVIGSTQYGINYTGDGTSGLYIWGPQLERNTYASKYTPTTGTAIASPTTWTNATGNTLINIQKSRMINGTTTYGSVGNTVIHNANTSNSYAYFDFTGILNFNLNSEGSQYTNTYGFTLGNCPVPTSGSFTISTFIRRNARNLFGRENVFGNGGGADGWRFGFQYTGGVTGVPYYLISGAGAVGYQEGNLGTINVCDGNWHLLTIVYDRAAQLGSYTVYGYVDNVLSGSATITAGAAGNVPFSANAPGIGVGGCCAPFAGNMAYLATYNKTYIHNLILKYQTQCYIFLLIQLTKLYLHNCIHLLTHH
jgi:hypothetical protein